MRQIVLDTETTGIETSQGHRIIEIGAVEVIDRKLTGNHYHQYIQPNREIDAEALQVHGITQEFLADKPRFEQVAQEFMDYIKGAELIIHNAPFDVGFINYELSLVSAEWGKVTDFCTILDTLVLARRMHPGQKNNLDALCKRYDVNNTHRELHGALLDSEILADVYLMMTGGQVALSLGSDEGDGGGGVQGTTIRRLSADRPRLKVISANETEISAHEERLDAIEKASDGSCVWRQ